MTRKFHGRLGRDGVHVSALISRSDHAVALAGVKRGEIAEARLSAGQLGAGLPVQRDQLSAFNEVEDLPESVGGKSTGISPRCVHRGAPVSTSMALRPRSAPAMYSVFPITVADLTSLNAAGFCQSRTKARCGGRASSAAAGGSPASARRAAGRILPDERMARDKHAVREVIAHGGRFTSPESPLPAGIPFRAAATSPHYKRPVPRVSRGHEYFFLRRRHG